MGLPRVSSPVAVMERTGGRAAPASILSYTTLPLSEDVRVVVVGSACVKTLSNIALRFLGREGGDSREG
ncbi:hypothetical protein E2C01_021986 [Portunus trituberculatus]|uniref:Uncharacterized protein n=1 Tax=Portunus trituberculatus TaxID=210409 RepID=A0A5B7E627_PORTR|nr:hypothetical protein [Portunus trituberculatus]